MGGVLAAPACTARSQRLPESRADGLTLPGLQEPRLLPRRGDSAGRTGRDPVPATCARCNRSCASTKRTRGTEGWKGRAGGDGTGWDGGVTVCNVGAVPGTRHLGRGCGALRGRDAVPRSTSVPLPAPPRDTTRPTAPRAALLPAPSGALCRCPHRERRHGRIAPQRRRVRCRRPPSPTARSRCRPPPRSAARPRPVDDANGGPVAPGALAPPRAARGDWRTPVTRRDRPARGGGGAGPGGGGGGGVGGRSATREGSRARRGDAVPRRALVAAVLPAGLHAAAAGLRRGGAGSGRRGRGGGVLRAPRPGRPGGSERRRTAAVAARGSVRFGPARGRPAPRCTRPAPGARPRSAVQRGPEPDPPRGPPVPKGFGAGPGGADAASGSGCSRQRPPGPAPCRRLPGHVLPSLGVRRGPRAGLPLARPLCGALGSEPPGLAGSGMGSPGRGGLREGRARPELRALLAAEPPHRGWRGRRPRVKGLGPGSARCSGSAPAGGGGRWGPRAQRLSRPPWGRQPGCFSCPWRGLAPRYH